MRLQKANKLATEATIPLKDGKQLERDGDHRMVRHEAALHLEC